MEGSHDSAIPLSWSDAQTAATLEAVPDGQAPALTEAELSTTRGGAALLEHQSLCPFRAFAEHRLQSSPVAEPQFGLSPAERGTLVHEALQVLWQTLGSHASLKALDSAAEQTIVAAACESALPRIPGFRQRALGKACLALEAERLRGLLIEWLDVERARADFAIAALEEKVTLELSGLTVRLRVDRIDTLPDGSSVIIDYKTGRARIADWLGERPARPQMLLYGLASAEAPAALAFAQVRAGECAYRGIGVVQDIEGVQSDIAAVVGESGQVEDWPSLNRQWAGTLQRLVDEFVSGEASVNPQSLSACRYCGQQPLCRIGLDVAHD